MLPIIPGTERNQWEAMQKALHERQALMSREAELETEQEAVPDDINEGGTAAEQAEPTLTPNVPEPESHTQDNQPILELPGIPERIERVVIVKRYREPWSELLLLAATYLAENFRFILALLVAAFLMWCISDAQAAIIFR